MPAPEMHAFICTTCGTQFADSAEPPAHCPICEDERQYVGPSGQAWTTPEALAAQHWNGFRRYEPSLMAFATFPAFGIGQRAFVVRTAGGNVLWDCVAMLDDATVALIEGLGGLSAIAISHPHYYTTMVDWSRAFGGVPVHLHEADRQWVMRPDPCLRFWSGERMALGADTVLLRAGGHFAGGTVMHWTGAADGAGVLLSGDIAQVAPDRRSVSFLWSYPNMIPLSASVVRAIGARLGTVEFARVYGAFWGREILGNGSAAVRRSVARIVAKLAEER
ncbi:MAG TPA: MBL fold metallo-hydrolase [Acetobacteraceae bacterium]|nr:MBL fold metallo-hydrolase [Acetobacteraceae bacterium]